MPTQIAVTPVIRGQSAKIIYEQANKKRDEASKKGAAKLAAKYKDKIKISVNCSSW